MTFAQITYRESLRDIEACLRALGDGLYHMGTRRPKTAVEDSGLLNEAAGAADGGTVGEGRAMEVV